MKTRLIYKINRILNSLGTHELIVIHAALRKILKEGKRWKS